MVTKNGHAESSQPPLARLAALYNVQTRYRDVLGRERVSPDESVIQTLLALGAEVNGRSGLASAVRAREVELRSRMIEPVVVAWEGRLPHLALRLPSSRGSKRTAVLFELDLHEEVQRGAQERADERARDGAALRWSLPLEGLPTEPPAEAEVDAAAGAFVTRRVPAGQVKRATGGATGMLPSGYHRLRVEAGGSVGDALVISAPKRCWRRPPELGGAAKGDMPEEAARASSLKDIDFPLRSLAGKEWGLFAPLYALRTARDWGAGDLADLRSLTEWTRGQGGALVATLPLLAASFEKGADPSPYRPLTRLFWNEFFIAPELAAEWSHCPSAQALWATTDNRELRDRLRAEDLVDYDSVMTLKRRVLEQLASCFVERRDEASRRDLDDYVQENPLVREYAAFRADGETKSRPESGADREAIERYHLYCQWQMDRQLTALSGKGSPGLMLDLPLGVHPDGFDVEHRPALFAAGVSSGAPPDAFFAKGQDWTTPPVHPQADRLRGYEYFRGCLRTHMRHASVLRIDHMMSFHRLFWIPVGMEATDGVYVAYPAEELYAVLSCESHRSRTEVVGEDLGTVPAGVRASMNRHAVARTSIVLGSLRSRARNVMPEVPPGSLVTLETHDMVPLAGFLNGDDIEIRLETGQLGSDAARREHAERRRLVARLAGSFDAQADDLALTARRILAGTIECMAQSAAKMVLVGLEDLLLERQPQNVPGTGDDRANWRRKVSVCLEDLPRYPR
jgi:4-alpha-glucanotransferase